jgi:N-acetylmuramoyl-L-alanine amidase
LGVIAYNESDVDLMARLMRAEAEDQGQLGELLVGNVGVNRVIADCLDFKDVRTVSQMVYQSPGGFEATQYSYFYQRAREQEKRLARKTLKGLKTIPPSIPCTTINHLKARHVVPSGLVSITSEDLRIIASIQQQPLLVHRYTKAKHRHLKAFLIWAS